MLADNSVALARQTATSKSHYWGQTISIFGHLGVFLRGETPPQGRNKASLALCFGAIVGFPDQRPSRILTSAAVTCPSGVTTDMASSSSGEILSSRKPAA